MSAFSVTAAAAAAASAADQGSGGLPQFDLAKWPGQMVWMLVIFGVMLFLFAKVFVPRVGGTIAEREDRISGDIGDARKLKAQADEQAAAEAAAEMGLAPQRPQKVAIDAKNKAAARLGRHRSAGRSPNWPKPSPRPRPGSARPANRP